MEERNLQYPYCDFASRKKVTKNGATVQIEFKPLVNLEIPKEAFEKFRADHHTIADSNFGLGIDIIEPGFMNMLKYSFKKMF